MARIAPLRWLRFQELQRIREKQAVARQLHIDSVVGLVGTLTMSWAGVERILDELIAFYQHNATDLKAEHPRSLSSKLKYVRLMQCDNRLPDATRAFLRTARIEAKRLGDRRHELIHGMLWRRPIRSGEWQVQRIVYDGPFARIRLSKMTDKDLRDLLIEIHNFASDLSPKVWVLTRGDSKHFSPGQLEEARRQLGFGD